MSVLLIMLLKMLSNIRGAFTDVTFTYLFFLTVLHKNKVVSFSFITQMTLKNDVQRNFIYLFVRLQACFFQFASVRPKSAEILSWGLWTSSPSHIPSRASIVARYYYGKPSSNTRLKLYCEEQKAFIFNQQVYIDLYIRYDIYTFILCQLMTKSVQK